MAIVFCDSYDTWTTLSDRGYTYISGGGGGGGTFVQSGGGRNGTSSLRSGDWNEAATLILPTTVTGTIIVGFAFRTSALPSVSDIIQLQSSGGTAEVTLRTNSSGQLYFTRNGTTIGATTATGVVQANVYMYIEIKVTFHASTGVAILKVNEVELLNGTSLNTLSSSSSITQFRLFGTTNEGGTSDIDDLVVMSTSGSVNNDFIGDCRVQAIFPSGNGNSSMWVGSDGNSIDNYLLVDEPGAPSDTDAVLGSTVGDKDTYAFGNLSPTVGTVAAVQIMTNGYKTDAGARSIATVARLAAGTEEDGASVSLGTTSAFYTEIRNTKPGGGAWTIADVNGAEFGVKVTV